MSITHEQTGPFDPPPPTRPGPFLCGVAEAIPSGWQRTDAAPGSTTCLAYDPRRHTVMHSFPGQPDDHLVDVAAQAGFERFEVPGSPAGFFARDRSALPPLTIRCSQQGLGR